MRAVYVLITILIVAVLVLLYVLRDGGDGGDGGDGVSAANAKEAFTSAGTDVAPASPQTGLPTAPTLPRVSDLVLLLTSFKDDAFPSTTTGTYSKLTQKWINGIVGATNTFVITGPSIPNDVVDAVGKPIGLSLKNLKLTGPSSDVFSMVDASGNNTFTLGSFTAAMYVNINSLASTDTVTLFRMYAETPNRLEWSIAPGSDAKHMNVNVIIDTTLYTWEVELAALVASGPSLLTIVFDQADKSLKLYMGMRMFTATVPMYDPIRLGNSPVEINSTANLDASLLAFLFYKAPMGQADVAQLNDYMFKQAGGFYSALSNIQAVAAAQASALATLVLDTNSTYQAQLSTCSADLEKAKAAKCTETTKPSHSKRKPVPKWQVNMDGAENIDASDLKCGLLNVDQYKAGPSKAGGSNKSNTYSSASSSSSAPSFDLPSKWTVPSEDPATPFTKPFWNRLFGL
jgi:hypothetical protein